MTWAKYSLNDWSRSILEDSEHCWPGSNGLYFRDLRQHRADSVSELCTLSHPPVDRETFFWAPSAVCIDFSCYHLQCGENELRKRITSSRQCAPLTECSYVFHNKANLSAHCGTRSSLYGQWHDGAIKRPLCPDYKPCFTIIAIYSVNRTAAPLVR